MPTAFPFPPTENLIRVGQVCQFHGAVAPTGFLVCDGNNVSRTTYADLFAEIGTTYGPGDGSTTFRLPTQLLGQSDVVMAFNNATSWYKLYRNGWVECGGQGQTEATNQSISLPFPMQSTNYFVEATVSRPGASGGTYYGQSGNAAIYTRTTTTFSITSSENGGENGDLLYGRNVAFSWSAHGFIGSPLPFQVAGQFTSCIKY